MHEDHTVAGLLERFALAETDEAVNVAVADTRYALLGVGELCGLLEQLPGLNDVTAVNIAAGIALNEALGIDD